MNEILSLKKACSLARKAEMTHKLFELQVIAYPDKYHVEKINYSENESVSFTLIRQMDLFDGVIVLKYSKDKLGNVVISKCKKTFISPLFMRVKTTKLKVGIRDMVAIFKILNKRQNFSKLNTLVY